MKNCKRYGLLNNTWQIRSTGPLRFKTWKRNWNPLLNLVVLVNYSNQTQNFWKNLVSIMKRLNWFRYHLSFLTNHLSLIQNKCKRYWFTTNWNFKIWPWVCWTAISEQPNFVKIQTTKLGLLASMVMQMLFALFLKPLLKVERYELKLIDILS